MLGIGVCEPGVEGHLCSGEDCQNSDDCFSRCCSSQSLLCQDSNKDSECVGDRTVKVWAIILLIILLGILILAALIFYKRYRKEDADVDSQDVPILS
jgi:hypothetical protein